MTAHCTLLFSIVTLACFQLLWSDRSYSNSGKKKGCVYGPCIGLLAVILPSYPKPLWPSKCHHSSLIWFMPPCQQPCTLSNSLGSVKLERTKPWICCMLMSRKLHSSPSPGQIGSQPGPPQTTPYICSPAATSDHQNCPKVVTGSWVESTRLFWDDWLGYSL